MSVLATFWCKFRTQRDGIIALGRPDFFASFARIVPSLICPLPDLRLSGDIQTVPALPSQFDSRSRCSQHFSIEKVQKSAPAICPHGVWNYPPSVRGTCGQIKSKYRPWYRYASHFGQYLLWDSDSPRPLGSEQFPPISRWLLFSGLAEPYGFRRASYGRRCRLRRTISKNQTTEVQFYET